MARLPDAPPSGTGTRSLTRALDKLAYSYRQQTSEMEGIMLTPAEARALYEAFRALTDPARPRKALPPV